MPGTAVVAVDVHVDEERALDDVAPGTTTDDLAQPAGTYELSVFAADTRRSTSASSPPP